VKRQVEAEWLDSLPVHDPEAVGSRRDLERLNGWMGHRRIMARTLRSALEGPVPRRIVEVGAGDGGFMLDLARRLSPRCPDVAVALVDQQEIVAPQTRQAIAAQGWPVACVKADVLDWLGQPLEGSTRCSSRREEALASRRAWAARIRASSRRLLHRVGFDTERRGDCEFVPASF
jgi:hypothetical protein